MGNLIDRAINEKYKESIGHDSLSITKDGIDWNGFLLLLKDIYDNDTEQGGAPNIPITIMVKVMLYWSPLYLYHLIVERCLYRVQSVQQVRNPITHQEMIM